MEHALDAIAGRSGYGGEMKSTYAPPKPHKGIPVYVDGVLFDKMTMPEYAAARAHWPTDAYSVRVYVDRLTSSRDVQDAGEEIK